MGSRPILQALLRHPDAQHIKKGGQKMNVPSERTSRMISMLLVLTMLMGLLTVSVSAQPAAQGSKVEDAILYTINADNELEYNVVYSSAMTEATPVSYTHLMGLGLVAFVLDSVVGVLFVKVLNLITPKNKINPMVGAAGISAFPMSARVMEKLGQEADSQNHLLMHAVAANVSGQIASVVAGGVVLQYFANNPIL